MATKTKTVEMVECDVCDGSGEVHSHNPICWECHGRGEIPKSQYESRKKREAAAEADSQRRDTVKDMWWQMTKKEKDQIVSIAEKVKKRYDKKLAKMPSYDW